MTKNRNDFLAVNWPGKNTKQAPKKTTFSSRANVMGVAQKSGRVFTFDRNTPSQFNSMFQKIKEEIN